MSLAELRDALNAELEATPEFIDFKVLERRAEGPLWRVTLDPSHAWAEGQRPGTAPAAGLLDDSLDGAAVWWGGPPKGSARVLAVWAEDDQLLLQHASTPPPEAGGLIRLYPTRHLAAVADAWWDTPWAERALALAPGLSDPPAEPEAPALTGEPFRWLRPAQRTALATLPHWRSAFLWGPPGTGKTTTLGVLLAEWLDRRPDARVLLLSTTHAALDLAVLAVDKALQHGRREALRPRVQRLGSRFDAAAYQGREHLIPRGSEDLIARLARAEAARPSPRDAAALQAWSERVAALRAELRASSLEVLRHCRLAAMTASRAAFTLRTLRQLAPDEDTPPFDLVVFDEASQVSLAHALVLMPLGRQQLLAGDPQQLSPVQRSPDRGARLWLGRSPFSLQPRTAGAPSVALLDEQSRMAEPIGTLVSELFYDGALRVARDALARPDWLAERRRALGPADEGTHVHVEPVDGPGHWSAAERGPVRPASAEAIARTVARALQDEGWRPHELVVLTPFRAQRARIRRALQALGVPDTVRVSTVHRAQGSEAPALFFDPVDATLPFLQTEEARRLLNVALSRAQAKLLLYLSDTDTRSALIAPLVHRLRLAGDPRSPEPLQVLAAAPGFPANALGRLVQAGRVTGEVTRLSPDGRQLWLVKARSGEEVPLDVAFWRQRAAANE